MVEKIKFLSDGYQIEGRLEKGSRQKGAVITHPHPLYGGDMFNNVVAAISKVYRQNGYTTLRFNFRGVGNSQGSYGDGLGEQNDVRAAITYLADSNVDQIDLAGYSFGAWVNALAVNSEPQLASRDDIAPPDLIKKSCTGWNAAAQFEVIEGADHFYIGYTGKLEAILAAHLEVRESSRI